MDAKKLAPNHPTVSPESPAARAPAKPEAVRRARFHNLIWREAKAESTHLVRARSAGPNPPQPDVPVEWLKELDHR